MHDVSVGSWQVISPPLAWLGSSLVMLKETCIPQAVARELVVHSLPLVRNLAATLNVGAIAGRLRVVVDGLPPRSL